MKHLLTLFGILLIMMAAIAGPFGLVQDAQTKDLMPSQASAAQATPTRPTITFSIMGRERQPTEMTTFSVKALAQVTRTLAGLSGVVVDENGPVGGASVRIQLTDQVVATADDGTFHFPNLENTESLTLTAWANGYYINWALASAESADPIEISLNAHYAADNADYEWFSHQGVDGSAACGICHTAYTEWQADAHSQTATNVRFLSIYQGTDIHGNKSPNTRYGGAGEVLPRDTHEVYYGPGYKLDNPERDGSCATCHTPAAAKIPNNSGCGWSGCHTSTTAEYSEDVPPGVSPVGLTGDAAEGISCEMCHKVHDVTINRKSGLPYADSPGILSMRLLRPKDGHDLFFGPLDDVVRTDIPESRDSYLPLQTESEFCAGCHYGVMGGVVGNMQVTGGVLIYSSYQEWKESPYSDAESGQSCQDCHMPRVDSPYFVFPEKGGQARPGYAVSNHTMPGATDEQFLQNAVTLTGTAYLEDGQVVVDVSVTNDKTGHHVPTDSPLRHVLLIVEAKDAQGNLLGLEEGPTLPEWAGDQADLPGRYYAKILRDLWEGEMPTGSYWREVELVEDTRLAALATDTSSYRFVAPTDGVATVEIKLIYRRAYQALMEQKAWTDPDIIMEQESIRVQ